MPRLLIASTVVVSLAIALGAWWLVRAGDGWSMDEPRACQPPPSEATDLAREAAWTRNWPVDRWRDGRGCAVRADVVYTFAGAEHCDWQTVRFLLFDGGRSLDPDTAAPYVRDRSGALGQPRLRDGFARLDAVPAQAVDTGLRRGRWALWRVQGDEGHAYLLRDDGTVERWPRAPAPILCA